MMLTTLCTKILTLLHTSSGIPMNAVLFFGAFYFCCSAGCRGELQYEAVGWSNVVAGSFQVDAFCIALHYRGWSSGGWTKWMKCKVDELYTGVHLWLLAKCGERV